MKDIRQAAPPADKEAETGAEDGLERTAEPIPDGPAASEGSAETAETAETAGPGPELPPETGADPEPEADPRETLSPEPDPAETVSPEAVSPETAEELSPEDAEFEWVDEEAQRDGRRRRMSRRARKRAKILCAVLPLLLLCAAAGVGFWQIVARADAQLVPVTVGIGEEVRIPALEDRILSHFLYADPPLEGIDTSSLGTRRADLKLCRFLERSVDVTVIDRFPPEFETIGITAAVGIPVEADAFVKEFDDQTEVRFSFAEEPDFSVPGTRTAAILATDEGGNETLKEASLTVTDETVPWELGADPAGLTETVLAAMPGADSADVSAVDGGTRGLYEVSGKAEDRLYRLYAEVRDTTPPAGTPLPRDLLAGQAHEPEEFVSEIRDELPVAVTFRETPDFDSPGETTVLLSLEDGAGNQTLLDVPAMVWDFPAYQMIEFGTTAQQIRELIFTSSIPHDEVTILSGFTSSLNETGLHEITLGGRYGPFSVVVEMEDTKPPTAVTHDFDLLLGERAEQDDFITDLEDYSGAEAVCLGEPDFTVPGEQTVRFRLSDPVGNAAEVEAHIRIWDIPRALTAECGTDEDTIARTLFASCGDDTPRIEGGNDLAERAPGEYPLTLVGGYSAMTVALTLEDTTPPLLSAKDFEIYVGESVGAWDFASRAEDRSGVTLRLDTAPDTSREGKVTVTLVAADGYGNESRADAVLTVLADHDPPVIYGAQDQKVYLGNTVSFRKNVWAEDGRDGSVNVAVDSSAVNLYAAGVYPVVYSASDNSGNTASVTVYITVTEFDEELVYSLADGVLSRILPWSGGERDKALAVFNWVSGSIRYSSAAASTMGQYWRAAYSGLTGYTGNCYTYYAVSSVLLTRAGIENIMVERNVPNRPHYWNLVKIDGNWYHFDTCPHYDGCDLWSFLLTDAEVADYSANVAVDYYSFDASLYPATP